MNNEILARPTARLIRVAALLLLALPLSGRAQGQGGGSPTTAQAAAPIDLTGVWVSVISEDWRQRMITPQPGDYESVPLSAEGRSVADTWDPARDEAAGTECKAYGAPAVMRAPGRLQIHWADSNTLQIDVEAGNQTRLFHFGDASPPAGEPIWQGHSIAEWEFARTLDRQRSIVSGNLKVMTSRLRPGYLRKNGVPYSEDTVLTEYYDVITDPDGGQWLILTAEMVDPVYLSRPFIVSTHFKKLPDSAAFNPESCSAR